MGYYYRINLQIKLDDEFTKKLYYQLTVLQNELEQKISHEIRYGSQLFRLKIDLSVFDNYDYENWGKSEFDILHGYLNNIIQAYYYSTKEYDLIKHYYEYID